MARRRQQMMSDASDRHPRTVSLLEKNLSGLCAEAIRVGELVVFPTETIYGIGGAAFNDSVWRRLDRLKPDRQKPYTYLVANWDMAQGLIGDDVTKIRIVAEKVWPGPVTLVITASEILEKRFVAEDGSIGLRVPAIDRIRHAIQASRVPWVHTSANLSGGKGIRNLRKLEPAVRSNAGLLIDGRTTALGGESTVVDLRVIPARVMRQGVMPESRLREMLTR